MINSYITSISTSTIGKFSSKRNLRPSFEAESSTSTLVTTPMDWVNPDIQRPLWTWMSFSPVANLGLPKEKPSILSLNHPFSNLDHFALTNCLLFLILDRAAQNEYLVARCLTSLANSWLTCKFLKNHLIFI